jgi:hypothetical protein
MINRSTTLAGLSGFAALLAFALFTLAGAGTARAAKPSDPVLHEMNQCMLNGGEVGQVRNVVYCCRKVNGEQRCVKCIKGTDKCVISKRKPTMSINPALNFPIGNQMLLTAPIAE